MQRKPCRRAACAFDDLRFGHSSGEAVTIAAGRAQWIKAERVSDIYSVSGCVSKNFADYINYWKHNGYWFFDSPRIIQLLEHLVV